MQESGVTEFASRLPTALAFRPLRTGLEIARQLVLRHAGPWMSDKYIGLLGNQKVFEALCAGKTVDEMDAIYRPELDRFIKQREKYLLYP